MTSRHKFTYDPDETPTRPKGKFSKSSLHSLRAFYARQRKASTFKKTASPPIKNVFTNKFASTSRLSLATKQHALSQVQVKPQDPNTIVNPYPYANPREKTKDDKLFKIPMMHGIPFKASKPTAHAHHQGKPAYAQFTQKHVHRSLFHSNHRAHLKDDVTVEDDLGASFANNMSLNSPPHAPVPLPEEDDNREYVPMDISPAPQRVFAPPPAQEPPKTRSRLTRTASQRSFGRDVSNTDKESGGKSSGGKRLARSALPAEWLSTPKEEDKQPTMDEDSGELFAPVRRVTPTVSFGGRLTRSNADRRRRFA